MANIDLSKYGITGVTEIVHNPSYEMLFEEETKAGLEGYEVGKETELGTVNVMTGIYTGRSPKDKYIVMDENSKDTVWWNSQEYPNDNHPMSEETWAAVKDLAKKELSNKRLFVVDAFCGANKDTRMAVRFIVEVAWQAHFVTNMFIKPTAEEFENFEPDFIVYNASKAKVENYKELGLNSETCVAFNITSKEQVIVNTWYGGEMKKGMFSMMNYYLPLKGIASMHCSANADMNGENTAIFFGLSGTGKTTLSTDPKRLLIGDDEHGWDDNGVFNFEGGCYAKVIGLDKESEPDIYNAIKRNALLENVTVDANGKIDFDDKSVTENTRVSYPINHITNIVKPVSSAPAAKNVIFLSADAFGVLPPVSILTPEQTQYYFLSGFTAKLAGTERGITEPTPTFSACFGQAFLELHPTKYAEELVKKMGNAIIMITHDLGVVADMADKIMVMYAGRPVEFGTAEEIFYESRHPYTWGLIRSIPEQAIEEKKPLTPIHGNPPSLMNLPEGCVFSPRCPYATDKCRKQRPERVVTESGHYSACHYSGDPEFLKNAPETSRTRKDSKKGGEA